MTFFSSLNQYLFHFFNLQNFFIYRDFPLPAGGIFSSYFDASSNSSACDTLASEQAYSIVWIELISISFTVANLLLFLRRFRLYIRTPPPRHQAPGVGD